MDNKENEVVYLHLDDIIPNRFQPRQVFDEKALKELAVSIKEHGVIQPIIVRNIGNKYEIIAGERRYKASAMAGLTTIPAIVRNLDDKYSVQGLSESDIMVTVNVKGVDSVISQLTSDDITAYINLKGYEPGEYEVPVKVEGTDVRVQYVSMTKKVKIRVVER